ncbi:MAG: hypothetical protein M3P95_06640 [Actinomycetota bacterium]|nr:hypothetical protein [Actinomycetota bacterium]
MALPIRREDNQTRSAAASARCRRAGGGTGSGPKDIEREVVIAAPVKRVWAQQSPRWRHQVLYDEVTLEEIALLGEVMAAATEQSQLTTGDLDLVLLLTGGSRP